MQNTPEPGLVYTDLPATSAAMELSLVGDLDEARTIELVGRTLGALPARETAFRDYADNRQRSFTADRSMRTVRHGAAAGPTPSGRRFRPCRTSA